MSRCTHCEATTDYPCQSLSEANLCTKQGLGVIRVKVDHRDRTVDSRLDAMATEQAKGLS
jgi:hypothetical protein